MTAIFKIGGSLLSLPKLAENLRSLVESRSSERRLVIVGGGASADIVREWSQTHGIADEPAHWLALSSLDLNRLLIQELTRWRSVNSRSAAELYWSETNLPLLLNLNEFAQAEEAVTVQKLPHSWDVTSDSMAAWVAAQWPADELILVKSVNLPEHITAVEASRTGLVDIHFPLIADRVAKISWCNLRSSEVALKSWRP